MKQQAILFSSHWFQLGKLLIIHCPKLAKTDAASLFFWFVFLKTDQVLPHYSFTLFSRVPPFKEVRRDKLSKVLENMSISLHIRGANTWIPVTNTNLSTHRMSLGTAPQLTLLRSHKSTCERM